VDAGFGTTLANWGTHPRYLGIRMTLIAAVGLDTYPVVFGDLLISGPERPDSAPDICLAGTVTSVFPAGSDWSILGLNQKVVLLGDNCVIAWAGNVVFARTVITGLRALASQAPLSLPIIEKYLAKLDPTMKDQVSLVGWVRDSEVFHQFWYRADIAESALFGRVSAGGSAATEFRHARFTNFRRFVERSGSSAGRSRAPDIFDAIGHFAFASGRAVERKQPAAIVRRRVRNCDIYRRQICKGRRYCVRFLDGQRD
jgi:hypothetical protein